jgi:hypothetical protein
MRVLLLPLNVRYGREAEARRDYPSVSVSVTELVV